MTQINEQILITEQKPIKISLAMICKNAEDGIGRALESVRGLVDEMIVLDTGSTDKTVEIAYSMGATVYQTEWEDDFAKVRNLVQSLCRNEWVMILDSDEWFEREKIEKFLSVFPQIAEKYSCVYYYAGVEPHRFIRYFMAKKSQSYWKYPVHNVWVVDKSKPLYIDDLVSYEKKHKTRDSGRGLRILEKTIKEYEQGKTRDTWTQADMSRFYFYYARELGDHKKWHEAWKYYLKYLQLGKGFPEERLQALKDMQFIITATTGKTKGVFEF